MRGWLVVAALAVGCAGEGSDVETDEGVDAGPSIVWVDADGGEWVVIGGPETGYVERDGWWWRHDLETGEIVADTDFVFCDSNDRPFVADTHPVGFGFQLGDGTFWGRPPGTTYAQNLTITGIDRDGSGCTPYTQELAHGLLSTADLTALDKPEALSGPLVAETR